MASVLVAYDGSPQSDAALDHAIAEFPDAELVVLTVTDPAEAAYATHDELPANVDAWDGWAEARAESVLDRARERAGDRSITTQRTVGRPGRSIVEFADDAGVDHVVIGCHGRTGVARLLLGSVAETVVRRAPVPVTVVR